MLPNRFRYAFTLIELVVVIVILGVLASIAAVGFSQVVNRSTTEAATVEAQSFVSEYEALLAFTLGEPLTTSSHNSLVESAVTDLEAALGVEVTHHQVHPNAVDDDLVYWTNKQGIEVQVSLSASLEAPSEITTSETGEWITISLESLEHLNTGHQSLGFSQAMPLDYLYIADDVTVTVSSGPRFCSLTNASGSYSYGYAGPGNWTSTSGVTYSCNGPGNKNIADLLSRSSSTGDEWTMTISRPGPIRDGLSSPYEKRVLFMATQGNFFGQYTKRVEIRNTDLFGGRWSPTINYGTAAQYIRVGHDPKQWEWDSAITSQVLYTEATLHYAGGSTGNSSSQIDSYYDQFTWESSYVGQ